MKANRLKQIFSTKRDISAKKDAFVKEFTQLESSFHAQTLGATVSLNEEIKNPSDFVLDPIYKANPIKLQMNEITGRVLQDEAYQYHTHLYKDLLTAVVPLRKEFRQTKDAGARKEMAKTEFDAWNYYMATRTLDVNIKKTEDEILNEEWKDSHSHFSHEIPVDDFRKLKEFFDRFKVSLKLILLNSF